LLGILIGNLSAEEKRVQPPEDQATRETVGLEVPGQGMFGEACLRAKRVYKDPSAKQERSPVIDGKLDDACWQKGWRKSIDSGPVVVENFHALNAPLGRVAKTKAYVCYDDEALYIAWECYDKGLEMGNTVHTLNYVDSSVKTTAASVPGQKKGPYTWDRRVHVMLDTVGDKNGDQLYNFFSNPAGLAYTTKSMGLEWNGVFDLRTSVGKDVWYAEMRIPYSGLNLFPKTPEFWRIDFERIMPGYIVWGGSSECTLDAGLMVPLGLPRLDFSEYCYQVEMRVPPRYFLGKHAIKVKVKNTSDRGSKVLAKPVLMTPRKERIPGAAIPVEVRAKEEKEISLEHEITMRGEHELVVELTDPASKKLVCSSERYSLTVPEILECALMEPHYRATIYATDPIEKVVVEGTVTPDEGKDLKAMEVSAELVGVENNTKLNEAKAILTDAGRFELVFPAKDLKEGKYVVSVKLRNANKSLSEKRVEFQKVPPAANEVVIDKNGNLLVNGKPFYPRGPFSGGKPEELKNFGMNCSGAAASTKQDLDALEAAGLKGFYRLCNYRFKKDFVAVHVSAVKDHPALLGWYLIDEPSGAGVIPDRMFGQAPSLKEQYEELRRLDPYHPVMITDYTPDVYKVYEPVLDILNPDIYPIHAVRNVPLEWVAKCLDRANKVLAEARRDGRGIKMLCYTPQAFGGPSGDWGRWALPSPAEMRCQTYLGVTLGMKGILYYLWAPNWIDTPCWREIRKLSGELNELAPILAGSDPGSKVVANPGGEVHVLLKEYEGAYYLIAVNAANTAKTIEFSVPVPQGFDEFVLTLPYEGDRGVEIKKGRFSDHFDAYEAHVYRMELK
jgi:hypothetical protein